MYFIHSREELALRRKSLSRYPQLTRRAQAPLSFHLLPGAFDAVEELLCTGCRERVVLTEQN